MNNSNDHVRVSGHSILTEVRGERNSTRQQIALANDTAARQKPHWTLVLIHLTKHSLAD